MTALLVNAILGVFILWGVCAVCMLIREDFDRVQRARRIHRAWRRK